MSLIGFYEMMKLELTTLFSRVKRSFNKLINKNTITDEEIIALQGEWSKWVILIGEKFRLKEDYQTPTEIFVDTLYDYPNMVLFKPTKASDIPYRYNREGAVSYMIGGLYEEDKGFALAPWASIEWTNAGILHYDKVSLAMGQYTFVNDTGIEVVAEFTIGCVKDQFGDLKIVLHHSSFHYVPKTKFVGNHEDKDTLIEKFTSLFQ